MNPDHARFSGPGLDLGELDQAMQGDRIPFIDTQVSIRVQVYAGDGSIEAIEKAVDTRETTTGVEVRVAGSEDKIAGAYVEVEDATLLIRSASGNPMFRAAIVNGIIVEHWVLDGDEAIEATEAVGEVIEE